MFQLLFSRQYSQQRPVAHHPVHRGRPALNQTQNILLQRPHVSISALPVSPSARLHQRPHHEGHRKLVRIFTKSFKEVKTPFSAVQGSKQASPKMRFLAHNTPSIESQKGRYL